MMNGFHPHLIGCRNRRINPRISPLIHHKNPERILKESHAGVDYALVS